jgi:hypothetical protein
MSTFFLVVPDMFGMAVGWNLQQFIHAKCNLGEGIKIHSKGRGAHFG